MKNIKRSIEKVVKIFNGNLMNQESQIKSINSTDTGKQYLDIKGPYKPYINKDNHFKMVEFAKYMGHYYDTKKGVFFMNKKMYKIIVLKNEIYFQHKNESFIPLKRKLRLMEELKNLNPNNFVDGLLHVSQHYSQILENQNKDKSI